MWLAWVGWVADNSSLINFVLALKSNHFCAITLIVAYYLLLFQFPRWLMKMESKHQKNRKINHEIAKIVLEHLVLPQWYLHFYTGFLLSSMLLSYVPETCMLQKTSNNALKYHTISDGKVYTDRNTFCIGYSSNTLRIIDFVQTTNTAVFRIINFNFMILFCPIFLKKTIR